MSAKCGECDYPVSYSPYPDEKEIADKCEGYCGQWLCTDCAMQCSGICTRCEKELR